MDYKVVKYSEIGKIRSGKRLPKGYTVSEEISDNKYIRVRDINNGSIDSSIVQYISDEAAEKLERYRVKTRDVIISVVGTVGAIAQIEESLNGAYLTENCDNLQVDESICLKDYLKYYLLSEDGSKEIIANTVGSTQPKLPIYGIENFNIKLPSIDNQKRIVRLLNSIDDKIKINNQINNNLEEQLKLFFEDNILKKLNDENTYECSLYDQFDVIDNRGKTPPLVEHSKYPIIDVKVLSGSERVINYNNCLKYVDKETYDTFFRSGHPKLYDTLLSTVGSLAELKIYLENIGTIAQNVVALRPKNDYPLFMYQYILSLRQRLTSYDIGSVQPSIKVTQFMKEIIKMPNDKEEIYKFENIAKANTLKMRNLMMENRYLEQLRDTLLPKLMNGEIDLDNIEI